MEFFITVLDATAKIPSGLLQGNGIQLGDFDQCLGVRARVKLDTGSIVKVQGKYCLAMVDVKAEHPDLEAPVHLAQARNIFKSRIDDVSFNPIFISVTNFRYGLPYIKINFKYYFYKHEAIKIKQPIRYRCREINVQ